MLIHDKYSTEDFLNSTQGQSLNAVRCQRDAMAKEILLMSHSEKAEEWVNQMVTFDGFNSGLCRLVDHFKGDHRWHYCELSECFGRLCQRVARLEREAAGIPISKYDYDLKNA